MAKCVLSQFTKSLAKALNWTCNQSLIQAFPCEFQLWTSSNFIFKNFHFWSGWSSYQLLHPGNRKPGQYSTKAVSPLMVRWCVHKGLGQFLRVRDALGRSACSWGYYGLKSFRQMLKARDWQQHHSARRYLCIKHLPTLAEDPTDGNVTETPEHKWPVITPCTPNGWMEFQYYLLVYQIFYFLQSQTLKWCMHLRMCPLLRILS